MSTTEWKLHALCKMYTELGIGISKELSELIELELSSLEETAEFLPDDDRKRVLRRCANIRNLLDDYASKECEVPECVRP